MYLLVVTVDPVVPPSYMGWSDTKRLPPFTCEGFTWRVRSPSWLPTRVVPSICTGPALSAILLQ